MNTDVVLAAEGEPGRLARGFVQTRGFILAAEQRLTRFAPDSELMQLNRAAGTPFAASADLFAVVQQAQALWVETGGLFSPAILPDLEAAGYDRSMDEIRQGRARPRPAVVGAAGHDLTGLLLDAATCTITLPEGMRLDLGGIAKGWIVQEAALHLAEHAAAAAVNAGGDMFLVGLPAGEGYWPVDLEDPRDAGRPLALLKAQPGALVTSSVTKRRWLQAGVEQHHLIDPRRRLPAQTEWLSATVLAASALVAEAYAKALLIGGATFAEGITRHDLQYLVVDRTGRLWGSAGAQELIS